MIADPHLLNIEQAGIQGDRAVVEGPHAKRPSEHLDLQKPRVARRKLRAKDHQLGVLPDEVGGDVLRARAIREPSCSVPPAQLLWPGLMPTHSRA